MKKLLPLIVSCVAFAAAHAQTTGYPFTVISQVREAGPKVVALSIDLGKNLPINWKLEHAFNVSAELLPVKSYSGEQIGNSAAAKAPRTIRAAYTSAKPDIGSPSEGRYVIIEMDPDDFNAASWYAGFNPSIRQMIPYKEKMKYEVKLLQDLNVVTPNVSEKQPGAAVETVKAGENFRQADARTLTADKFTQGSFEMPANTQTKQIGYNFYKPADLLPGAKAPLVVFLHGSGQSHDYVNFPNDLMADVLSPLLANQGGVAWVERAHEKAFVLVPQAPARDTKDAAGEWGWRSADTQKLLIGLVDKLLAENPEIDTSRLYLAGLSMGAMGSWKIINSPDPTISKKFAAATLFNGVPKDIFAKKIPGETSDQREARILTDLKELDYRNVSIPLWLTHSNTDPVVTRAGARVPFAMLTGKSTVDATGELHPSNGVMKFASSLVRQYEAPNRLHSGEIRYTEYQFGNGDPFRDLGMVTRNGHFSWEVSFKDQSIIDWMFAQRKRSAPEQ